MIEISKEEFLELLTERALKTDIPDGIADIIPYVLERGNFSLVTVIVVYHNNPEIVKLFTAASKRCPSDAKNDTGLRVAADRVWKEMNGIDPGYGRKRPTSKKKSRLDAAKALIRERPFMFYD